MRIETIRLKNFKAFKNIDMRDIPRFCVIVGRMEQASQHCLMCLDF